MVINHSSESVRFLAREMIWQGLRDIQKRGNRHEGAEALIWFNERSLAPGGYGWCLGCSSMNPNSVRKFIKHRISPRSLDAGRHHRGANRKVKHDY